ncbi:hypothetical protein DV532_04385 [Pseudomonas sp. Leaf58]|nr:hypothetical protein DV532_04385 [Pseudomonas sp. Leaf58]
MAKSFDMSVFLAGVLRGAQVTRNRHIRQAIAIQAAIYDRWGKENPWNWKRKHIVWIWAHHLTRHSASTRYYYLLTIRLIEQRMERTWLT